MNIQKDGKGNSFVKVENIRITYVPVTNRQDTKDWSGYNVLRFQAYRSATDDSLYQGAELPISSSEVFIDLISALCTLYKEKNIKDTL